MHALVLAAVLAQATPGSLALSASSVALNPAQQQVIDVTGAAPPLQATLDQKLVNVGVSPDGTSVTITATQATGDDTLHLVDANGARADLPIRVAFNAGTIVPQTTLTVTGDPAQPDWLAAQVRTWLTQLTKALPGAQVTIGGVSTPSTPLAPGASTQVTVPIQIAGNGRYFDQSGTTTVNVQNVALPQFAPALLFYDDDPEHVTQDGVLFRGSVTFAQPTRLYYYHDDGADPRVLVVALTSQSQDPTSVQLVQASAGPNMDVMHVGQTLTKNFLLTKAQGEGVVVNLSQDDAYVLADVPMAERQLVAGTVDFRVLSGGPVVVTVLGVSGGIDPRTLLGSPVLQGDGHHRTGIFRIAGFGSDTLTYTAGGSDATVVLGDADPTPPSADPAASGHDYGDYGVIHAIDLTLTNPGQAPFTAYLYLKPLAGPARGSFLIDGNTLDIGCVRVPTPYQITSFDLSPGQTYHTVVRTMTDGGSFYPVVIGVSATPPQPSAPAINAPDGCFPKPEATPAG
ncbi:MAG: hypothetical protein JO113_02090 [Candidatus Eremiobacteraeota bacterium]|nr:hypothetical protein [Candidatus Eremiobacteraeota bacterium]